MDWAALFDRYAVPYQTEGKNVGRDEINIACPFCGDDPSYHLGINLTSGYWHCWRNPEHSGKSPVRLVARTLGVPFEEARRLSNTRVGFEQAVAAYLASESSEDIEGRRPQALEMPGYYKPASEFPQAMQFLSRRGFSDPHLVSEIFDLKFTIRGDFKHRIIFPVYHQERLRTWFGRATGRSGLRYIALSPERGSELDGLRATHSSKESLLNYDRAIQGGMALFLVEGPVDCAKVETILMRDDCHAIGLGGVTVSDKQKFDILNMATAYDKVYVSLDRNFHGSALQICRKLSALGNKLSMHMIYPKGIEDPGELTEEHRNWLIWS